MTQRLEAAGASPAARMPPGSNRLQARGPGPGAGGLLEPAIPLADSARPPYNRGAIGKLGKGKPMARRCSLVAVLLVWWAPLVYGDVGDVERVACDPDLALDAQPLYATGDFGKPDDDAGTVHPKAVVTVCVAAGRQVAVAIDADAADAAAPDLLRLDFSGAWRFAGAPTVKLVRVEPNSPYFQATFGPEVVQVRLAEGQEPVPVTVSGNYLNYQGGFRQLQVSLGTALQARCRFGEQTLPVRVVDGNGNLACGDEVRIRRSGNSIRSMSAGDTILVGAADGSFDQPVRAYCGQPVRVGDAWYRVALSEDRSRISAEPLDLPTGRLHVDHPHWQAKLVGQAHNLCLEGGSEAVAVPADEYLVLEYQELSEPDAQGRQARILVRGASPRSGLWTVTADQTTEMKVGSPLVASVEAQRRGRQVNMSMKLVDAGGMPVQYVILANGDRPAVPRIRVEDADGQSVHTGAMEYG